MWHTINCTNGNKVGINSDNILYFELLNDKSVIKITFKKDELPFLIVEPIEEKEYQALINKLKLSVNLNS